MKRFDILLLAAVAVAATLATGSVLAADTPKDRIVAMYFHRAERCPTCKKMGAYSEEAVKAAFAKELKDGTVEFRHINFEDPKNARLTKGYKIEGPALIVANIKENKVKDYMDLEDIWVHVSDKPAFLKYVQGKVAEYQD